jgi:hypothetical protein
MKLMHLITILVELRVVENLDHFNNIKKITCLEN